MKILVINTGSSSIKYQLFDLARRETLSSGLVERIGEPRGRIRHKNRPGTLAETELENEATFPDHGAGLRAAAALLTDPLTGVIKNQAEIRAIGHRVVHGGERFQAPTLIDDQVLRAIEANTPLAPLHNPANIIGLETARALFPDAAQVAVFDTAFHQTIPPRAYMYALPHELYEKRRVRKYGFHGTSHKYVAAEAAALLGREPAETNLITIHLGNGGSITAVRGGKSVDTSMGLTPLAGLIMGARCGDIDPAIPKFLADNLGLGIAEIDDMLNKQSGLKGICGHNDMRDVHRGAEAGDPLARLALDMYQYRIKTYIGSYLAVLGRVDALVFTAGIGENDPEIRASICAGLENLGVVIDKNKNDSPSRAAREVQAENSPVKILVVPTNEELEIARQTLEVLQGA
ncbi:MAG: acetate kinase [Pseudomonadota bacterium]